MLLRLLRKGRVMNNKEYLKKTSKIFQKILICGCTVALLSGCGKEETVGNVSVNDMEMEAENVVTEETQVTELPSPTFIEQEFINEEEPDYVIGTEEEKTKEKSPLFKEAEKVPSDEELQTMSTESSGWGQGTQVDELNRPAGSLQFQEKYGSHSVRFIMNDSDEKVIYLTFDEGYENGYTSQILDVLKEKNVKAVFFITMDYAKKEPELVQRMIEEGHVVGNHSVTHPSAGVSSLSLEQQENEIMELHNYVKDNFGYEMYLFRCPAGIFSEQFLGVMDKCGYTGVFWSFAYHDWDPDNQMAYDEAMKKTIDCLHPGAIYLLHAVSSTNTAILGEFIDTAVAQGYTFK